MNLKKIFSLLILAAFVSITPASFAAIVVQEDGTQEGIVEKVNFTTNVDVSVSGKTATVSLDTYVDSRGDDAVLTLASSSTAIADSSLPYSVILKSVGGGGGLDSDGIGTVLPDAPKDGQCLSVVIVGLQPGGSWKVTPTTKVGFTSISFDTKGDTATLCYLNDSSGWYVESNGGAVINQA